jgi:hypothetical protein
MFKGSGRSKGVNYFRYVEYVLSYMKYVEYMYSMYMYPIVTSTCTVHGALLQGWRKVCLQDGILGTFLARNRVAYPYKVPRT